MSRKGAVYIMFRTDDLTDKELRTLKEFRTLQHTDKKRLLYPFILWADNLINDVKTRKPLSYKIGRFIFRLETQIKVFQLRFKRWWLNE